MKKTTRRVRWFQNSSGDGPDLSIRLKFDDQYGECNRFYNNREQATAMYEAWIAGSYTSQTVPKNGDITMLEPD